MRSLAQGTAPLSAASFAQLDLYTSDKPLVQSVVSIPPCELPQVSGWGSGGVGLPGVVRPA